MDSILERSAELWHPEVFSVSPSSSAFQLRDLGEISDRDLSFLSYVGDMVKNKQEHLCQVT